MFINLLILLASFLIILLGSEFFTNGVEWAGEKLAVSEAAVGSLLAAVGTALPETFIPLMALVFGRDHSQEHSAVGVGAIIGAPLMLSTMALFVMGIAGLAFRKRRRRVVLRVSRPDARRDLSFFLPTFLVLILVGLAGLSQTTRYLIAACLLMLYGLYAVVMLRLSRSPESDVEHELYLELLFRGDPEAPRSAVVALQVLVGVVAIIFGAREFVDNIVAVAATTHLNPGVLSLIISPLATELPEKYNSVVWIRQRKDHLALANITGAMVFQSCVPVAIGVIYSPWRLSGPELLAGAVGLVSSSLLFINLRDGELSTAALMLGGAAYVVFLAGLSVMGFF